MKTAIICLSLCLAFGCSNAAKPVAQNTTATNSATAERPQTAIAHGPQETKPAATAVNGEKSKWTASGDPIDTKQLDAAVVSAEKALAGKSSDASKKKALAEAYYNRAVALTQARQYASALGDYRRALKHDPENEEAKGWIDQIINIYASINREYPKDGEEPPPLPFTKGK